MIENTQPSPAMDQMQAVRIVPGRKRKRKRHPWLWALLAALLLYFFAPLRTNLLLLGADDLPERGSLGRTDTIILASVVPLRPYVGMLSIPRDLWVDVPGVGEQRINTAYFFAEAAQPGSGAQAAMDTVRVNFDVPVRYYALVHMPGLSAVIDALGGVDIHLEAPLGRLPAGAHHLNGAQALDFVRERSTSDDFGRMARTQVLISAALRAALHPAAWRNGLQLVSALTQTVETNLPPWQWPRMAFALLRASFFGIDSRSISREMVTPFQTSQGAQVLAPNWEAIRPLVKEMFGR